jgi:membrane-bound serine protease (ClpP class)
MILCLFAPALRADPTAAPIVDKIQIKDTVQAISAGQLSRAIAQAERDHAAALLVELDTPGGLLESTREMVGAILSSKVPVIVYIAPEGARGGSAGFFLLESADIAAMAPSTNAGASHPVLASGTPDDTMKQKIENDAAAFLRSYVSRRGRNVQAAEEAVRSSKSFSAQEALDQHLIDVIAPSDAQLLADIDGKVVKQLDGDAAGTSVTLHVKNAQIVTLQPTVRDQLLGYLIDPNVALLLLFGGALLIYLEFNAPGTIVPGALGTVMVLLAVFALNLLPIRHTAVLLLAAAIVLLVLEVKFASHGVLALAGIVCLAVGTLTLIDSPIPELRIQPLIAIALCVGFGGITVVLLRLALRARRSKALMGPAALVGAAATTMEPLWPAVLADTDGQRLDQPERPGLPERGVGRILVQGEIWQAVASEPVAEKASVRVIGFHGDILEVQPVKQSPPASAL